MATQQEIMKKFIAFLDTTTLSGTAAVSEAINRATTGTRKKFADLDAAIAQMLKDCKAAGNADTFLRQYCGIILGNSDTGAITGSDAGGKTIKTAESIIYESDTANVFTANKFTVNGLTVKLTGNYSGLSDYEKYLWRSLHGYWIKNGLELIAESYGDNFTFNAASTVRELSVSFINANTGYVAEVIPTFAGSDKKTTTGLELQINSYYYENADALNTADLNGAPNWLGKRYDVSYLDRSIAHELTHAVMQANVDYFMRLPLFIREGMAELTHGADDGAYTEDILALAADSSKLEQALSGSSVKGVGNSAYACGYMFLRWLAKQSAASSSVNVTLSNALSNTFTAGSNGNDKITNSGSNVTILGGDGNDTITNNGGSNVLFQYTEGDGNDLIQGFRADSTLQIGNGSDTCATIKSGSDIIVTVGDGRITLRGAASLEDVNIAGKYDSPKLKLTDTADAKFTLPAATVTLDASARSMAITLVGNDHDNSILGGDGNDAIVGGNGSDTLWGGAGDDSLWSSAGNDLFVYTAGNDLVADYATGDKISLGAAITKTAFSGSNVIITTGNGSLTVRNAKDKTLSLITAAGKELSTVITEKSATLTDKNSAKITLSSTYIAAYASRRTKAITLVGNKLNNTLVGGSGNDKFSGKNGADSLIGNAGNDSIWGGNDNDILSGGDGNDRLWGGDGKDTLTGGTGNDKLWGGDGADTFIYNAGDGKDVIYGFDDTDMLQITGDWSASYNKKTKKLSFKVGAGVVSLNDFTASIFHVNDDTYKISGSKLVKQK